MKNDAAPNFSPNPRVVAPIPTVGRGATVAAIIAFFLAAVFVSLAAMLIASPR